jgi:hypothetical protein
LYNHVNHVNHVSLFLARLCQPKILQDIVVARDADSVKKLFLEVGDVYITVEAPTGAGPTDG